MKKRSTYRLLVESEETNRNVLEIVLYAVFALSAVVSIWQFAEQPSTRPLHRAAHTIESQVGQRIAS